MEVPRDGALAARGVLELWDRLSRTHAMVGGSCACGAAGVVVALEDFEQDIADYLHAEAERLGRADVMACLDSHGREGDAWSIAKLLNSFADPGAGAACETSVETFVLERLGRTLQSFEKLHGPA
jgi:hypothetical protein